MIKEKQPNFNEHIRMTQDKSFATVNKLTKGQKRCQEIKREHSQNEYNFMDGVLGCVKV